jgi:CheY-like chemotaxis protein
MGGEQPHGGPSRDAPDNAATGAVLVVDEDDAVRAWVARVLGRAGTPCFGAASGRDALRLVADGRIHPAVLLTAIELSGMTGIELVARLLSIRPEVRVVMMTADPARAAAARSHSSIVGTVLLKPIDAVELVAAVGPGRSHATP